ncbi:MAG: hypothetical protein ACTSR0_06505 [Candidatus Asgardarchaeia archaeon]
MIHCFIIIDKATGISLFEKYYSEFFEKKELLPSFLTAIWQFAESEIGGVEGIKEIEMGGYRWFYLESNNFLFVIISDTGDRTAWIKAQLRYLKEEFFNKYPEVKDLDRSFVKKWFEDRSRWVRFEKVIDELIVDWDKAKKISEVAKSYDVTSVFHNILSGLYSELPKELKGKFLNKFLEIIKEQGLEFKGKELDLTQLNIYDHSYRKIRKALIKMFEELFDFLRNSVENRELTKLLKKRVYPIVIRDWKRIRTYGLDESIIKKILLV